MAGVVVRPATADDVEPVAGLIVDTPGGLLEVLDSREVARRVARRTFLDPGSFFGFRHTLVAEERGAVVGEMVRLSGKEWKRLRLRTGLGMLLACGPRHAWRLAWRGGAAGRAMAPITGDVLYVASLSVIADRRGRGIGANLLSLAVREASAARLRAVALDVASTNEAALRFYAREGFVAHAWQSHATNGRGAAGPIRMERSTAG